MKRILSLFLSFVLVLSMVFGTFTVNAVSTTSEPIKLVKVIDTTGRNYNDYKSEITTDVWSQTNFEVEAYASDATAFNMYVPSGDDDTKTRFQTTPIGDGGVTTGIHTVSFKLYGEKQDADGNVDFNKNSIIINRRVAGTSNWDATYYLPTLKAKRWYEIKLVYDLNSQQKTTTVEVIDVASDATIDSDAFNIKQVNGYVYGYIQTWYYITYTNGTEEALLIKDMVHLSDFGTEKASITSVGSDGSVDANGTAVIPHSQNKVKFTLDRELPGLTEDHVLVKSRQGGTDITASEITVTSDATAPSDMQWIVEATLSQNLAAWSEYDIAISKDYYAGYKEVTDTGYVSVTDITFPFSTPSAPLDIRAPQFANDGSATTDIISTIGNTDMTLVYTNTASAGYVKEIKTESISVNGVLNDKTISFDNAFVSGDTAKLFVIKGWNNPVPLFNKSWAQSYDGTVPEADVVEPSTVASSGEMVLGRFDYSSNEITVDLNAGSDSADANGVLYIYKRGTSMKDNLIYADYVTTANDGSLKKTITFPDDINDTTGEYTVAFYAENVNLSKDFAIYDDDAAFGGTVVKAELDTVGRNYDIYSGELTNWALTKVSRKKNATDETAFSITFPAANAADQNSMRISITPVSGRKLTGRHIVKFKFFADKADSEGYVDFEKGYFRVNRDTKEAYTDGNYTIDGVVKANKWYDIEIVFELDVAIPKSTIKVVDIETGTSVLTDSMNIVDNSDGQINGFKNIWAYLTYTASDDEHQMVFKDIQMLEDVGYEKSAIRYIGNGDVVDYNQNEIVFKISENNGLTKDNIRVTDSQGNVTKAKSISVTEDMGEYIITANMEKNFASNKTYKLNVDALGYENYRELDNGKYVAVKPISRTFTTPPAPIDITDPVITSNGSSVTFAADISNSTSSSVDATTILAVVSSDGIMQSVTADSDTVTSVKSFTNTNSFALGNSAEYFVIKGFANPVPLFTKTWSVNYDGTIPAPEAAVATTKAGANAIVLDEFEYDTKFDHANKKIVVNLNTGANAPVDGVLYVYSGNAMATGNLPIYADYVSTANDGTLLKEIKFDSSIVNTTKEYTVAFYSNDVNGALKDTFNVYNSADYLNYKRNSIYENVKNATTFSGIKQIITGTDDMGKTVCDAWDVFSQDANVSVYETLNNKEAVFVSLSSSASSLADYNALCRAFENLANTQKNSETNPRPVGPSSNNKNTGSSSVNMSATSSNPAGGNTSVSGGSVFSDMNGHWGQKYAEALVARGIVNGYDDGSFRGDNPITRAELTKIVVEALDVPSTGTKSFADIAPSSWYADYVSRAATAGVVNGFEDGRFGPEEHVTRQDAVLMIYRAMCLTQELPEGFKFFADEKDIQDYASEAIRCLGDLGIITGNGKANQFLPQNDITRAEMAAVICRALDYMESHIQ